MGSEDLGHHPAQSSQGYCGRKSWAGNKMKEGDVLSTPARWTADLALNFLVAEAEGTRLAKSWNHLGHLSKTHLEILTKAWD